MASVEMAAPTRTATTSGAMALARTTTRRRTMTMTGTAMWAAAAALLCANDVGINKPCTVGCLDAYQTTEADDWSAVVCGD